MPLIIKCNSISITYTLILFYVRHIVNDPFAGSPTNTLLRLLLPLNNKIHCSSAKLTINTAPTHTCEDNANPTSEHFV